MKTNEKNTKESEIENKENLKKDNSEDLKKELEKSNDKIKEYLDTLQHLQAEFENYRKRVEREKESFCKYASQELIEELLPILDDFDLSIKRKTEANYADFVKAVEIIYDKFQSVLKKQGLEIIDAEGKPFNPELHEPLLQEESDKEPNTIIEVLQNGYKLNDKVLRHSRVKISKQKERKDKSDDSKNNDNKTNNEK
jgi:molecular chaperone GrpE